MTTLTMKGLDGTNTLGFLAGLGLLRVLDDLAASTAATPPRLSWSTDGLWQAVLHGPASHDDVIDAVLADARAWGDEPALALAYTKDGATAVPGDPGAIRDLKPSPAVMRAYLDRVAARAAEGGRQSADLAAALGTDVAVDNNGNVKPTALHFTAGQQKFLKMAAGLQAGLTRAHVVEALDGPWLTASKLPSMSWDSTSARPYAFRATDPSSEKRGSVAAANWLGLRGLAFLPLAARGRKEPKTPCVAGGWKNSVFTWPLWAAPASAMTVRSLLGQRDLADMPPAVRAARGVQAVLQSAITRSDQGGNGAFSPSRVT